MAQNFYGWLINKLRYKRLNNNYTKLLTFGCIYMGSYSQWKHDPQPLIWVQWSDPKITHGINVHYLNRADKQWLGKLIYIIKRAGQNVDPRSFFHLLKQQRPSIIKTAYRVYHTNLLNMKLVSAGITPLDKLIYLVSKDPWVAALNDMIRPGEVKNSPTKIAFSSTELQNRIIQATNTTDIRTKAVPTGPRAPYVGGSPFVR